MLSETDCIDVLSKFPNVEFAFAYGSGVVEQDGYDYQKKDNFPMLDIILVVENSEQWHAENMLRNPSHYTSLIPLNASLTAKFQEYFSAHFWFNAYIPMNSPKFPGRLMKYGVISRECMLQDLNNWSQLYAAGRLHKPVHILKNNELIEQALTQNFEHAIRTSLLLLPKQFNDFDLFTSIASLSYIGDPRMFIGENPKKVINLVTPIVHHYRKLYQPSFSKLAAEAGVIKLETLTSSPKASGSFVSYTQNVSPESRWKLALGLPKTLNNLLRMENREKYLHNKPPKRAAIRSALSSIVARSASIQTIKGLFTVGLFKSSSYLFAKMKKRFMPSSA